MKLSPRRNLMKQIREIGVTEFKNDEETSKARQLYDLMKLNDQEPQKKKRKKKDSDMSDTEKVQR